MKKVKLVLLTILTVVYAACSNDDDGPGTDPDTPPVEEPQEGKFVVSALPYIDFLIGSGADLLYTVDSLDSGELSPGDGLEQDGTYRNYIVSDNGVFFSLLFGQGDPGAVAGYRLNAGGELIKLTDFQSETMTARAVIGDDILMIKNAWEPTQEYSQWYRLDTESLQFTGQGEINTNELPGNGEMALFTSLEQVGDKVFAPFWSIESGRTFMTQYPGSSLIAVFSYPEMELEKVIRDDRTGAVGAYFTDGVEIDEQGDIYVMATSLATSDGNYDNVKPAAFMKIKNGTTEYDKSYFFNLTDASGGSFVLKKLYLGEGNFLLTMSDIPNPYATTYAAKFAIANVYDATFRWVTGVPDAASVLRTTEYSDNYAPMDGKTGYLGIIYSDEEGERVSAVYKFDAETATATKGLSTGENVITAINWVPVTEE